MHERNPLFIIQLHGGRNRAIQFSQVRWAGENPTAQDCPEIYTLSLKRGALLQFARRKIRMTGIWVLEKTYFIENLTDGWG